MVPVESTFFYRGLRMNDFNDIAKDYVNLIDDTLAIKGGQSAQVFC